MILNKATGPLKWAVTLVFVTVITALFIIPPPRDERFWIFTVAVCWIELVFTGASMWRASAHRVPTGAAFAIMLSAIGLYGVVLTATVAVYCALFRITSDADRIVTGLIALESVAGVFVLSQIAHSDGQDSAQNEILSEVHQVRRSEGLTIMKAKRQVTELSVGDTTIQRRRERLVKRLYAVECALQHSHIPVVNNPDADLNTLADSISAAAAALQANANEAEWNEIERLTTSLETKLSVHGIS